MGFQTRTSSTVDSLFRLLAQQGARRRTATGVSQLQHALQTGLLAADAGAPPSLVTAALLHDIGHLADVDGLTPAADADAAVAGRHEVRGAALLGRWFGPEVTEPVRLHVAAKRYLLSQAPDYVHRLSAAAIAALGEQGGAMRRAEGELFCDRPHADGAVMLRIWDDAARVPGRKVPGLSWFRPYVETALAESRREP